MTYKTNTPIACLLVKKIKQGIVLKTFKTFTFTCALQKSGDALVTAYPIQETEEAKLEQSMRKLHLKDM